MSVKNIQQISADEDVSHDRIWTEGEAAEFLNLSVRTLQTWRVEGRGPKFSKLGRCVRYRMDDLQAYVNENVFQSTTAASRR